LSSIDCFHFQSACRNHAAQDALLGRLRAAGDYDRQRVLGVQSRSQAWCIPGRDVFHRYANDYAALQRYGATAKGMAFTLDTASFGALVIKVTGKAAKTIKWIATFYTLELVT
jgi:hypothetical protein